MLAGQALQLLRVSRKTLHFYVKDNKIKVKELPNGRYDYNDEDIYRFLNKDIKRKIVIYARVSTQKQKKDLENQIEMMKTFCVNSGVQINSIYSDISSGISFEKRKEFFLMLDEILDHKVEKVIITYKDRLSRVGFELFSYLFKKYGTEIIVISDVGNKKLDSEEIFEEIVSLLHSYSMKLYSKRHHDKKKIEIGHIEEDINDMIINIPLVDKEDVVS